MYDVTPQSKPQPMVEVQEEESYSPTMNIDNNVDVSNRTKVKKKR